MSQSLVPEIRPLTPALSPTMKSQPKVASPVGERGQRHLPHLLPLPRERLDLMNPLRCGGEGRGEGATTTASSCAASLWAER